LNEIEPSPDMLQVIAETMAWCLYREQSGKPMRSPELDPSDIFDIPEWSHESERIEAWIEKKRNCYRRAVPWINETRAELLKASNVETFEANDVLSTSRLLIYEPLETVDDGAAEAGSMGFYDVHDAPPWDTWFLYADHAVFCCVPEFAISQAQDGIDANPVDCIRWGDWSRLNQTESKNSSNLTETSKLRRILTYTFSGLRGRGPGWRPGLRGRR
jgi:hypothetical protein